LRTNRGRAFDPVAVEQIGSLQNIIRAFLDDLAVRNYSPETIRTRREMCLQFAEWCAERDIIQAAAITRPLIERYQKHLFFVRDRAGKPLSINYQNQRIMAVQSVFRWAVRKHLVGANPAADIDRPRPVRRLPDHLTVDELLAVLAAPDTATPLGVRDRAILEVLYSTGIRRAECVRLTLHDIDHGRGVLRVIQGKGHKDRAVPIGSRAREWVQRYVNEVRSTVAPLGEVVLFLTEEGRPFQPDPLGQLVRKLLTAAGIHKTGSCHLFRHTMATHLVERGCDVRLVQEMLGHAKLDTTALYTHVGIAHLVAAHAAHHPAEDNDD
jgi:integrase/recombinase XerD